MFIKMFIKRLLLLFQAERLRVEEGVRQAARREAEERQAAARMQADKEREQEAERRAEAQQAQVVRPITKLLT